MDDKLVALGLTTKKTSSVPTKASDFTYPEGTAWSSERSAGQKEKIFRRFSLAMPELTEPVCKYSGEFAGLYPNLYANGPQLHYQASGAKKLGIKYFGMSPSSGIDIILPNGGKTILPAFLIQPYALEGRKSLTATENQAEFEPTARRDWLYMEQLKAYVTPEGSVVPEAEIGNSMGKDLDLMDVGIKLRGRRSVLWPRQQIHPLSRY